MSHSHSDPTSSSSSSGSSHSSDSSSMMMDMIFHTSSTTPLYSSAWTPQTSGTYAGTCIFLIILAIIARLLLALKTTMEQRWLDAARARRYIVVEGHTAAGSNPEIETSNDTDDLKMGTLISAHGLEEKVRVVRSTVGPPVMPWRFSVDLPRAALVTVITGVGYLLMLAVMTMNVGYFLCVLAGIFIGDLGVGRYAHRLEEH